jgi:hypothetical protein
VAVTKYRHAVDRVGTVFAKISRFVDPHDSRGRDRAVGLADRRCASAERCTAELQSARVRRRDLFASRVLRSCGPIVLGMCLIARIASAQSPTAGADIDTVSLYVWRGVPYREGATVQPSVGISARVNVEPVVEPGGGRPHRSRPVQSLVRRGDLSGLRRPIHHRAWRPGMAHQGLQ